MKFVVTTAQMGMAEDISQLNGVSKYQLMENAGSAIAKAVEDILGGARDKSIVILCGKGNNGGDGLVAAERLTKAGAQTLVIFTSGQPTGDQARQAQARYQNAYPAAFYGQRPDAARAALAAADMIIDCVFGTGFHGRLEEDMSQLFKYVNSLTGVKRASVDIPSGVNGDTGEICENAFHPENTMVLAAMKQGMLNHPCSEFCGEVKLLDIGISDNCYREYMAQLTDESIMELQLPRLKNSNKGTYGHLLNITGSSFYRGAALLSSRAALRAGAGLVTVATTERVWDSIVSGVPEAVFYRLEQDPDGFIDRGASKQLIKPMTAATAAALGCGIGNTESGRIIVKAVLQTGDCPLILDADGINCVSSNINVLQDSRHPLVLTPHPMEFSRLTGMTVKEIQADRLGAARTFAREKNLVLLLKGVNTVIAAPDGRTFVNSTGNPALAKAGTGDVLTGIIGGFLAGGMDPFYAAALGAYVHGKCADKLVENASAASILASDIVEYIPYVLS